MTCKGNKGKKCGECPKMFSETNVNDKYPYHRKEKEMVVKVTIKTWINE
jgi:hypothetical protein